MNGLALDLLPDMEPKPTELQELQAALLELVRRSREADPRTNAAFRDFLLIIGCREAMRGATWR